VRTLKRQIATLYFGRSGLSNDKETLAALHQGFTGALKQMSPP
jgi:predicted nuclease of restriction endonuclease-like (RecB) superfamily